MNCTCGKGRQLLCMRSANSYLDDECPSQPDATNPHLQTVMQSFELIIRMNTNKSIYVVINTWVSSNCRSMPISHYVSWLFVQNSVTKRLHLLRRIIRCVILLSCCNHSLSPAAESKYFYHLSFNIHPHFIRFKSSKLKHL